MVTIISTLFLIVFGVLYPLFLWITDSEKIGRGFHRFTLSISSLMGSLGVTLLWLMNIDFLSRVSAAVWILALITVSWFYWSRPAVQAWVVSIPSLLGIIVYVRMVNELVTPDFSLLATSILGGFILSGSIFSMVLGHWYLNVVDLPMALLRRSIRWLFFFLVLRVLWDTPYLLTGEIDATGSAISLLEFIQSFNGFFLFIALFFGTALPLVICVLALRTVAIHSTQSATGLLYVVVISVAMGDLFYKYYALQFGLFL